MIQQKLEICKFAKKGTSYDEIVMKTDGIGKSTVSDINKRLFLKKLSKPFKLHSVGAHCDYSG